MREPPCVRSCAARGCARSLDNYKSLQEARAKRISAYWRSVANTVDRKARFWFPFWYVVGSIIIFSLHIEDGYTE